MSDEIVAIYRTPEAVRTLIGCTGRSLWFTYLDKVDITRAVNRKHRKPGDIKNTEQARMVLHVVSLFFRLCTHRYIYQYFISALIKEHAL